MKTIIGASIVIQVLIASVLLSSCQHQEEIQTGEGYIKVDGGKVWYRVTGNGDKISQP